MTRVRVVTDSTSDVPSPLIRDLDVTVVPLNVHFGTETFRDHVDLSPQAFYEKLSSFPGLPTTSQPAVGTFQETYRELAKAGDDIISIHLASRLSGTYASALAAAKSLPELRINVVDSQLVSIAAGWPVIAAAEAALRGAGLEDVTRLVTDSIGRTRLYAALDTLEYVRRGGRIGKASALVGTLLNIKPIVQVKGGEVLPVEKVRTKAQAVRRLVDLTRLEGTLERVGVAHAAAPDEADHIVEMLSQFFPREGIITTEIGPVIGTHAGPRAVGIGFVIK